MTKNQYFKDYLTNSKNTFMHDLNAIYNKVKPCILSLTELNFDTNGNCQFYPNLPKLSDVEILALALTAECCQIDSENLLWSKIKTDYPLMFNQLPHRTKFNKRRKRLAHLLQRCLSLLSQKLVNLFDNPTLIIDSMPISTCKIIREKTSKSCRRPSMDEVLANKGRNIAMGGWFIGYKFHLITTEQGIYKDFLITSASVHDSYYLKLLGKNDSHLRGCELLADRGYIGQATQLRLFEENELTLNVPYRRNQKDFQKYDYHSKIKRKTIEVIFSQYCDEFNIKRNYAKRFEGFFIRLITKVMAKTFKQFYNHLNGNPINRTKHSLAA